MSNIEFELPNDTRSANAPLAYDELPSVYYGEVSPANIPVVEGVVQEDEEERRLDAFNTQSESPLINKDEYIQTQETDANGQHDAIVRERYASSMQALDKLAAGTQESHDKIIAEANRMIATAGIEFNEWQEQAIEAKELMIQAIEEQFIRKLQMAHSAYLSKIENGEKIIDREASLLISNLSVNGQIKSRITSGVNRQRRHEQTRNAAEDELNKLVNESEAIELSLAQIDEKIASYNEKLETSMEVKDLLETERLEIRAAKNKEINKLAKPHINQITAAYGLEADSPELADSVKDVIRNIRNTVSSEKLDAIKLRETTNDESIVHNKSTIENNGLFLDRLDLKKTELQEQQAKLPELIKKAKVAYEHEVTEVAQKINNHSQDAVFVVETLSNMNDGDITAVAGNVMPDILRPIYENKVEVHKALTAGQSTSNEYPEPVFDTTMLAPLRDPSEEEYSVSDVSAIPANQREMARMPVPFSFKRIIRRGLGKADIELEYNQKSEENKS